MYQAMLGHLPFSSAACGEVQPPYTAGTGKGGGSVCKACAAISPPPQLKCQHRMLPSVLSLPLPNVPDSLSELLSSLGARACGIMPPVFTHGPIMSDARDALTGEARSFLLGLLQPDPRCRLGRQTPISQRARPRPQLQSQPWLARDVRGHAFLSRLSWQVVESKQCAPPFDRTVQARPRCSRCERRARHMQRQRRMQQSTQPQQQQQHDYQPHQKQQHQRQGEEEEREEEREGGIIQEA